LREVSPTKTKGNAPSPVASAVRSARRKTSITPELCTSSILQVGTSVDVLSLPETGIHLQRLSFAWNRPSLCNFFAPNRTQSVRVYAPLRRTREANPKVSTRESTEAMHTSIASPEGEIFRPDARFGTAHKQAILAGNARAVQKPPADNKLSSEIG
jgi:hypothetical protein